MFSLHSWSPVHAVMSVSRLFLSLYREGRSQLITFDFLTDAAGTDNTATTAAAGAVDVDVGQRVRVFGSVDPASVRADVPVPGEGTTILPGGSARWDCLQ